jgi:hypothetical protein
MTRLFHSGSGGALRQQLSIDQEIGRRVAIRLVHDCAQARDSAGIRSRLSRSHPFSRESISHQRPHRCRLADCYHSSGRLGTEE